MVIKQLKQLYFKEQFVNYYKNNFNSIISYILSCRNEFRLTPKPMHTRDVLNKKRDSSLFNGEELKYLENGLEIIYVDIDFWNIIKEFIPKSITKLELPIDIVKYDLTFLSSFPNLIELTLSSAEEDFTPDEIKYIYEHTNIKKINEHGYSYNDRYRNQKDFYFSQRYCLYKDLLLERQCKQGDTIIINAYELDKTQIERIINLSGNEIKKITILSTVDVYIKDLSLNDKTIGNIDFKLKDSGDVKTIEKVYNYLIGKGYKLSNINLDVSSINYYELDIDNLDKLSENIKFRIKYLNSYNEIDYALFSGMFYSINWYRKIIKDSNLSPLEKLMFAYDIMKTFPYKEAEDENLKNSRKAHLIIEYGTIVCVGYSRMMKEILKALDENIRIISVDVDCYNSAGTVIGSHKRNLVQIDDDKYNIHGIFALDATWDSVRSKEIIEEYGDEYTALDFYTYFLVPISEYADVFTNENIPRVIADYVSIENPSFLIYDNSVEKVQESFKTDNLDSYMQASRPSLEIFNSILHNVRLAEGFSKDQALAEVEKVYRMNKLRIENEGDMPFFEDGENKKHSTF